MRPKLGIKNLRLKPQIAMLHGRDSNIRVCSLVGQNFRLRVLQARGDVHLALLHKLLHPHLPLLIAVLEIADVQCTLQMLPTAWVQHHDEAKWKSAW